MRRCLVLGAGWTLGRTSTRGQGCMQAFPGWGHIRFALTESKLFHLRESLRYVLNIISYISLIEVRSSLRPALRETSLPLPADDGFSRRVPLLCSGAARRSRPGAVRLRTPADDGSLPKDPARSP